MTSLTADAGSFSSGGVRVMGQSSPQDVACGVVICRYGVLPPCWQANSTWVTRFSDAA